MCLIIHSDFSFSADEVLDWQKLYDEPIKNALDILKIACPDCGSIGFLHFQGRYDRYFFNSTEDIENSFRLSVVYVRCTSRKCSRRNHVIFPSWICPYSPFSYPFLLKILNCFYDLRKNLSQTARTCGISRETVRTVIKKAERDAFLMNEVSQTSPAETEEMPKLVFAFSQKIGSFLRFLADFFSSDSPDFSGKSNSIS